LDFQQLLHFALGRLHFPTFEKFEHFCLHTQKVPPSNCVLARGVPRDRLNNAGNAHGNASAFLAAD
jgi:hypothetical protein